MIERRLEVDGLIEQAHLVDGRDDLLVRDARGIADIDDDLKLALAELDDIGRHGEPARLVLELGEPVLVAEQAVDDVLDVGDVLEVFEEGQHGVFAELGRGAVRALADADELLALDLEAEALCLGDLDAAGQHFAVAADHVGSAPALHIEEGRAVKHEVETELQDALFRIDDGEVRIGREARLGHVRDFVVVLDAAPAALFVAADDELDLLARDEALILERLQGIECADRRSLVVRRAAAPDLAVGDLAAEGIVRPALPRGDDIEVAEDGKLLPFAEDDFAHIIIVVMRFKAHARRKGKEIGKALCRTLAEGRFGRSLRERRVRLDEIRDRPDRFFLIPFHYDTLRYRSQSRVFCNTAPL